MISVNVSQGNENIERLELAFKGNPLGIYLTDNGQNGTYSFSVENLVGAEPEVDYLFEIIAEDKDGNKNTIFPYLHVK